MTGGAAGGSSGAFTGTVVLEHVRRAPGDNALILFVAAGQCCNEDHRCRGDERPFLITKAAGWKAAGRHRCYRRELVSSNLC